MLIQFILFLLIIGFLLCLFGSLYEEYLVNNSSETHFEKEIDMRKWLNRFSNWLFWLFKDL